MQQEAERVFRLLKILYPEHDMHSAYVGLHSERSGGAGQRDRVSRGGALAATARADRAALRSRRLAAQRAHLANRLLGASLGDREEAIAVMMLSQDPWLQSCAAYAIGEFRLVQFADQIEEWCTHPDPLLRSTARMRGASYAPNDDN